MRGAIKLDPVRGLLEYFCDLLCADTAERRQGDGVLIPIAPLEDVASHW